MKTSRGESSRGRFSDIKFRESGRFKKKLDRLFRTGVVNLKPTLRKRYPLWVIGGVVAAAAAAVLLNNVLTRAEVADFYPSICLGTWQNPQNAQGEPETFGAGDPSVAPSESNAAVYRSTNTKIFCGGFVPQEYEAKGNIRDIGLTLVWLVGDEKGTGAALEGTIPESAPTSSLPAGGESDAGREPTQMENATTTNATTTENEIPSSEPASQPTSFLQPPPFILSNPFIISSALAQEASYNPSTSSGYTGQAGGEQPTSSSPAAATEENRPAATEEESTTTVIIAPPLIIPLEPLETSTQQSAGDAATSSPAEASSTVALPPPLPPDDHFLKVSYSTDGQYWIELQRVSGSNWRNLTLRIPLTSWDDLKNLQVSIEGVPTTRETIPLVLLDGMLMEVHYEVPPVLDVSLKDQEPENIQVPPVKPVMKIFDPESKHRCSITPFSQIVKNGDTAMYQVSLLPSFENARFWLQTGDLPPGVSAALDPERGVGTSTPKVTLSVEGGAGNGSFDVVVVYREIDKNFNELANFCQLNIIIE